MAISLLTEDKLWPLLDGGVQVVIANGTESESAAAIIAAVVAAHGDDGSPRIRRTTAIDLAAGESFAFEDDRPAPGAVLAVEAILRVTSAIARVTTEVYVASDAGRTTPIDSVEIGIAASGAAPPGAVPIADVAGLSAYIKLEP